MSCTQAVTEMASFLRAADWAALGWVSVIALLGLYSLAIRTYERLPSARRREAARRAPSGSG